MRKTPSSLLPKQKTLPQGGRGAASATDPSLLEASLLVVHKLTERVDDMEVRAADQKISIGVTITRLRRRVRTLESGSRTIPSIVGEAGNVYVTYPVLNARDYIDCTTLNHEQWVWTRASIAPYMYIFLCI